MALPSGLYERLVDAAVRESLADIRGDARFKPVDGADAPLVLARHLMRSIHRAFRRLSEDDDQHLRVELANEILRLASVRADAADLLQGLVSPPLNELQEVVSGGDEARLRLVRPDTPLSAGCILTGSRSDPTLESQVRKEMASADRVDFLCSFIKWSGVRTIRQSLEELCHRPGTELRVLTTCYTGATELKAVEFLAALNRAGVRVSYDTKHTRMHAKAYLFHRQTGFSTAYVGSANLSHAAMTEGLEWVVKVSQAEAPHLWEKLVATFDSYWNDGDFRPYTGDERERLATALAAERGTGQDAPSILFDLKPHDFQQEILDQIEAERQELGKKRHLIVSAAGTGKTMIAAFDYRRVFT